MKKLVVHCCHKEFTTNTTMTVASDVNTGQAATVSHGLSSVRTVHLLGVNKNFEPPFALTAVVPVTSHLEIQDAVSTIVSTSRLSTHFVFV